MKSVTLYHSVICPRCQLSKLVLKQVLKEFPDVRVEKKELFGHMQEAKAAGAKSIPALVWGDRVLRGVIFTPARVRAFLESLPDA